MDWEFLTSVGQILVIDVVLSGDNAVVIALAAHRLPPGQRRLAILCGAGGAIGLRVLFTFVLARLLGVPLLRLIGGLVLVWISMKLLLQEDVGEGHQIQAAGTLLQAVWTIVLADFVMSLDNMLAVGGASEGSLKLIAFGLLLSIAIIMMFSTLIAWLMNRYPVLVFLGAAVLALTAAEMILEDERAAEFFFRKTAVCAAAEWHPHLAAWSAGGVVPVHRHAIGWALSGAIVLLVVTCPWWWTRFAWRRRRAPAVPPPAAPGAEPAESGPPPA